MREDKSMENSCSGYFPLHRYLWLLEPLGNGLIQIGIANRDDCQFKFHQNRSRDAKVIRGQSEDSPALYFK